MSKPMFMLVYTYISEWLLGFVSRNGKCFFRITKNMDFRERVLKMLDSRDLPLPRLPLFLLRTVRHFSHVHPQDKKLA